MKEISPSKELADLIENFEKIGGEIHYVLMKPNNDKFSPNYKLHKESAKFFLDVLQNREMERVNWVVKQYGGCPKVFEITYNQELMRGQFISVSEFLGCFFDEKTGKLRFVKNDNDRKEIDRLALSGSKGGYSYAFSHPPYPLRAFSKVVNDLFSSINRCLFDNFDTELDIYEWATDWSNFFDAGNEWWGSFLWTIHNKKQDIVVAIGASASD